MNRRYRIVFNRTLSVHQVASECTRAQGKSGAVVRAAALTVALLAGLPLAPARAVDLDINGGVDYNSAGDASYDRITVGRTGSGLASLTIDGGDALTTDRLRVGFNTAGTVTVSGAGSTLTTTNINSFIGGNDEGTLIVENGGAFISKDIAIGGSFGSGNVTVTGAGSTWVDSLGITISEYSDDGGTVTIKEGGRVKAPVITFGLSLGYDGTGTLNLLGSSGSRGILETAYLQGDYAGGDTAAVNFDGGILRATGDQFEFFQDFNAGAVVLGSEGLFFDTQGYYVGTDIGLQGTGGLTKQGSGTLAIAGSNTYDGNTTIEAGTLQFDNYTQSGGQTLGISAASDASYGKLAVTHMATFDAHAKINVDVAGTNTLATGQALLGVITAGTLTSTGFDVNDNSALFNFNAIRTGNSVDLRVVSSSATGTGIRDAVLQSGATATLGAADVLDNAINNSVTGDMGNVVTALGSLPTDDHVSHAATQTLPLLSAGVTQVAGGVLRSFNRVVQDRQSARTGLSAGDVLANRAVWFKPFGSHAAQDDRDGASGFDADTWGIAGGIEGDLDQDTRIGIAYAYANSNGDGNTTLSGTRQHVDIDSHVLALYGSRQLADNMAWGWQADVGQNSNSGTRHIDFGGLNRTASADYKTYTAHLGMSLSKTLILGNATRLVPAIRADYTVLHDQGYREQGADALNLDVDANDSEAFVLGAEARIRHALTEHSHIDVHAGAGYDTLNQRGNVVAAYAGVAGQSFATQGIDHSPWLLTTGVGYAHALANGTEITLRYDVDGRSDYLNQSASIRAKWMF